MTSRGLVLAWGAWCAAYLALSAAFFSDSRTHAAALNDELGTGVLLRLFYREERWLWFLGLVLGVTTAALAINALHKVRAPVELHVSVALASIASIALATIALQSTPGKLMPRLDGQDLPQGFPDEVAARAGWIALAAFGLVAAIGGAVAIALRAQRRTDD